MTLFDIEEMTEFFFDYNRREVYRLLSITDDGNHSNVVCIARQNDGVWHSVSAQRIENANPYCGIIPVTVQLQVKLIK